MNFETNGNQLRCKFTGDLSSDVCALIEKELNAQVSGFIKDRDSYAIVFDLAEARYISSAFLRLCLFHCKQAGNKHFSVENSSADLKKVFQIAGFTEMMNIK